MNSRRHFLVLPELGLSDREIVVSVWLVDVGEAVSEGDRLLEVLAGSVTVDLPSPTSGVLVDALVTEDEPIHAGQVLGVIESDESGEQ